jgi:putative two-component system response regulator
VVDFFDALTMDRCYRPALPEEVALQMLAEQSGAAFDPHVVEVFLAHADEMIAVRDAVNRRGLGFGDLSADLGL